MVGDGVYGSGDMVEEAIDGYVGGRGEGDFGVYGIRDISEEGKG